MQAARAFVERQPIRSVPRYELRGRRRGAANTELEVWQLPSHASPHLKHPKRVAGLAGRNLALIEPRLLKRLRSLGIELAGLRPGQPRRFDLDETSALRLGLTFRMLAPMRNRSYMRGCVDGIEDMGREEAAYWLGMAMHRRHPRRVLAALRMLLVDPKKV